MKETELTYRDALTRSMSNFLVDPLARVLGYGILNGKGANGTLKNLRNEQTVETTVAENLLMGMAQGMAMTGLRPMVYLERGDFVYCCMSALASHLDKCKEISRGEFSPCVLIRIFVGKKTKPLFTGPTHVSDPTEMLKATLRMPVYRLTTPDEVMAGYGRALFEQKSGISSSVLVEYGDLL
jgi:pyruvate dehydrogenase E1 component beta subunit